MNMSTTMLKFCDTIASRIEGVHWTDLDIELAPKRELNIPYFIDYSD